MVELTPKCLSGKGYGYSAQGYLLPCCWCDPRENRTVNGKVDLETEEIKSIFFKEHLKLTNVDSIMEILTSKEWKNFYDTLLEDQNNAPEVCKRFCNTTQSTKLKEKFGQNFGPANWSAEEKARKPNKFIHTTSRTHHNPTRMHSTAMRIRPGEQDE